MFWHTIATASLLSFVLITQGRHTGNSHASYHASHLRNEEHIGWQLHGDGSTTTPKRGNLTAPDGQLDIPTFIDDFVKDWKLNSLIGNASPADVADIHKIAEQVKEALLSRPAKKRDQPLHPSSSPSPTTPRHRFIRRVSNSTLQLNSTLTEARKLIRLAQKEANIRNRERIKNPRRNEYYSHLGGEAAIRARAEDDALFVVNETVATAAALVAEADAVNSTQTDYSKYIIPSNLLQHLPRDDGASHDLHHDSLDKRATSSFWVEEIQHQGRIPYGGAANNNYKVYRNVKDYGAVGDGKTDDTAAINKAISDGGRCGANCGSSTVKGALVYFPAGTYLISSPIISYYHTQLVGNANNRPVLKAAKSFIGLGLVTSDVYTGGNSGSDEWYINQNNFLRQVRNFVIDVSGADMDDIAGLHHQVAQLTSVTNVAFIQSSLATKNHMGIFAENGSGGFMSDLTFFSGAIGIRCGNQQFTTRNFIFIGCRTAIDMLWDWGWTWKSLVISNAQYGIKMTGDYNGGSIIVLDSSMTDVTTGIYVTSPFNLGNQFSIVIDNLKLTNVGTAVNHKSGGTTLAGGSKTIESWVLGKVYDSATPKYQMGGALSALHPKTAELRGTNGYFERSKPQYETYNANSFINVRMAAMGDGAADDSFALSLVFAMAAAMDRPVYIPMGSYTVAQTVRIPKGSRIVGECWSQIVAKGIMFEDMNNPSVMVQVGEVGDVGLVEISDLMFTTEGPTAGVILMEWNIAQTTQGSVGMWDCGFRIGGAAGSRLQVANCPKLTGSVNPKCIAGTMMLHMTPLSSGYLENVWAWVSDHDLDSGVAQTQIDIYVARGILIESRGGPVWMYGTASEHSVLYQYQLYGAKNVFMGNVQTESPYFLPKPQAPAPFTATVGKKFPGDPEFSDCLVSDPHCAAAWGVMIQQSTNVQILGAGLYNWFQEYTQLCVDTQDCQKRVFSVTDSGDIWVYNLYTIGTVEMVNYDDQIPILAKPNTNALEHPYVSNINAWLMASTGTIPDEFEDDDYEEVVSDWNLPSCTADFDSLDAIKAMADRIPWNCRDRYMLALQIKTLESSLDSYTKVVKDGYDSKFAIYERVVRDAVPDQIAEFMAGAQASGFFKCVEKRNVQCCKDCTNPYGSCATCVKGSDCKGGSVDVPIDCWTTIPRGEPTYSAGSVPPITYTCTNPEGFYKVMEDKYGVQRSWIKFGTYTARIHANCQNAGNDVKKCQEANDNHWYNYPLPGDIKVPNPKAIIDASYDAARALQQDLHFAAVMAPYQAPFESDLVDSTSVPSYMMQMAVDSMSKVVEVANEIIEQQRKEMIAFFLEGILMLIPMAGAAAGAVDMAVLRSILNIAEHVADLAMTIYDVVDDPGSALVSIFGVLLSGGASRKPFKEVAEIRRHMAASEKDKLGPVKDKLDAITDVRKTCVK